MRTIVFDVPATQGGALTILEEFYKQFCEDSENEYILVVSEPQFNNTKNVQILRYPWVKKSWLHRLVFEFLIANKLVRRFNANRVLSLQNIAIPFCRIDQEIYVHNALPFAEYRYSFREDRLLWIYQNIIGRAIIRSIKKAKKVIVQTYWMKSVCAQKAKVDESKIVVVRPQVALVSKGFVDRTPRSNLVRFFYPANASAFKNHKAIFEACKELSPHHREKCEIILTVEGKENKSIAALADDSKNMGLPISFVGYLSKGQVIDNYKQSVLLFPSLIESYPLPLLEAKMCGSLILVSDYSFSHEVLGTYKKVRYFDAKVPHELAELMREVIDTKLMNVE